MRQTTSTSGKELSILRQAATGLTSSGGKKKNVHHTLFIPLTISCVLSPSGGATKAPPENTHQYFIWISNILTTTVIWPHDSREPHKFKDFVSSLCCWYWISNLDGWINDFAVCAVVKYNYIYLQRKIKTWINMIESRLGAAGSRLCPAVQRVETPLCGSTTQCNPVFV